MYKTTNLYLAGVLYNQGNTINSVDSSNPHRAVFYFDNDRGQAKADADRYWNGEINCNAKQLITDIAYVKSKVTR